MDSGEHGNGQVRLRLAHVHGGEIPAAWGEIMLDLLAEQQPKRFGELLMAAALASKDGQPYQVARPGRPPATS